MLGLREYFHHSTPPLAEVLLQQPRLHSTDAASSLFWSLCTHRVHPARLAIIDSSNGIGYLGQFGRLVSAVEGAWLVVTD